MKLFKKLLSALLALTALTSTAIPAFAVEAEPVEQSSPRVLQVLIVSEDGSELYTGEEAVRVYNELNSIETTIATPNASMTAIEPAAIVDGELDPTGAFSYEYRFLPDANDGTKVYGSYSIISDPWGNATSLEQTASFTFTATSAWSVNCTLTGKFKDAVELAIGGDWSEEYSATVSHEQTVAPKKRVWLQYKPEYILHSGKAQKYYVTRGTGILIVEESKDVDIREAYMRQVSMGGHTYNLPAGAYVWCEDSDYMNRTTPVIQN